jgi:hypothetical protein
MEAPWNGEKVSLFIRILAVIFIICGLIAFCSLLFSFFERGNFSFENLDFENQMGSNLDFRHQTHVATL